MAFQELPIDTYVARHWAYDATVNRWIGHGRWWADDLLHTDGRDAILLVIAGLLITIAGGLFWPRWSAARGTAIYLLATIALAWGLVGLLKHVTNVPCPWSLLGFGGERPHVGLFSPRPAGFGPAACFPGAHSASGFALFAFYFAFRDRRPRRARLLLAIATLIGAIFAFGQEARGAHFLSHDVSSAFLAWFVALGTYLVWRHPASAAADRTAGTAADTAARTRDLSRLSSTSGGASFLADHLLEALEVRDQRGLVEHAHLAEDRAVLGENPRLGRASPRRR